MGMIISKPTIIHQTHYCTGAYLMVGILDLPTEIIHDILDYSSVTATRNCIKVCRQWQHDLTGELYRAPYLRSTRHYLLFVETILSRPELGMEVQVLNLSRVIGTLHTTRLPELLKSCPGLREFYTPQAALAPHTMQVLPSLHALRILDLECCIERFEMSRVINYCSGLRQLHTLRYPRCAVSTTYPIKAYPPNLTHLALRGGIKDDFLRVMADAKHPAVAVTSLMVAYAPSITANPLLLLIRTMPALTHLTITWPIMRFAHNSLDGLLLVAPKLRFLSVAIDYISPRFLENSHAALRTLEFKYSGVGKRRTLSVEDLTEALDEDDRFPALQVIGISPKLADALFQDADSRAAMQLLSRQRGIRIYTAEDVVEELASPW